MCFLLHCKARLLYVDIFAQDAAVEVLITEITDSGLAGATMRLINATADIIYVGANSETQKKNSLPRESAD